MVLSECTAVSFEAKFVADTEDSSDGRVESDFC